MSLSLIKGTPAEPLVNPNGHAVSKLTVGVGWDKSSGGKKGFAGMLSRAKGIDLDLAGLVYDNTGSGVRVCGFDTPDLFGGGMHHTGDNKTGKGDGIDESMEIDLDRLPPNITGIVVTLNAFKKGVSFANIAGADCFFSENFGKDLFGLGQFAVPIDDATKNTIFMARILRDATSGGWTIKVVNAMGSAINGDPRQLLSVGKAYLTV
ncbi:MAG: TerD family protein [Candidatus Saccharimonadales bacterium]